MELINKDALIAEIEKLIDKRKYYDEYDYAYRDGNNGALYALKEKIYTLEVKEVDLDLEITLWAHELYEIPYDDVERMAKYFFELGLKAKGSEGICKISETNCPNFDEAQGTPITK